MLNHFGSGTTKENAQSIKGADGEGFWPELDFLYVEANNTVGN